MVTLTTPAVCFFRYNKELSAFYNQCSWIILLYRHTFYGAFSEGVRCHPEGSFTNQLNKCQFGMPHVVYLGYYTKVGKGRDDLELGTLSTDLSFLQWLQPMKNLNTELKSWP